VTRGVHARHFGRLAADECAAGLAAAFGDARNDLGRHPRLQLPGGEIIQEEERLRALGQDIVNAHRYEIDANGIVTTGGEGQHQLGADAIRSRDEHRILEARRLQIEQAAESAQRSIGAGAARRGRHRLDRLDQRFACVDVHTGVAIGERLAGIGPVHGAAVNT
jgi:hypothetical protein